MPLNYRDNYERHIDEEDVEMGSQSFDSRWKVEEHPVNAIPKPFVPTKKLDVDSTAQEAVQNSIRMEKEVKLDEKVFNSHNEKDNENSQDIDDFNSRRQSSIIDYDMSQHDDKESFVAQHIENSAKKSFEKAVTSLDEVKETVETEEIEGKIKEIDEIFTEVEEVMDEIEWFQNQFSEYLNIVHFTEEYLTNLGHSCKLFYRFYFQSFKISVRCKCIIIDEELENLQNQLESQLKDEEEKEENYPRVDLLKVESKLSKIKKEISESRESFHNFEEARSKVWKKYVDQKIDKIIPIYEEANERIPLVRSEVELFFDGIK